MGRAKHRTTAVLATAAVAALVPVAPAIAGSPSASANVATVGSAPALPYGAQAEGATPLQQSLSFDVVLKPRNQAALDSFVQQVSTPGSPQYRHFLAPGAYATTFGPTPQTIASVESSIAALGLKVTSVTGSVVSVSGSVAQVGSALHTSFSQYQLASGRIARANTSAPKLPLTVAPLVQGVVGLDDLVQLNHGPVQREALAPQTTAPVQTCVPAGSGADGYYNEDQLASYYGLGSLYTNNTYGAGIHVALFELEPFRTTDINHFQSCYGTSATVNTISVGGVSPGDGGEATLDIEDVIGLAPAATLDVYEGLNNGSGILNVYNKIATNDTAQVVSTSWGSCELFESGLLSSERAVFQQMATQGQTVFAASGDSGSEACYQASTSHPELSVGDPASQPEVTGVGGTDLQDTTGPEYTWNDWASGYGAGGGGISAAWPMPAYQAGVVDTTSSGTPCGASAGSYCREVPDVSASASPLHAYLIYWSGTGGTGWYYSGGTSAAAPTWASTIALIDSSCSGNRLGLINPALYQLNASSFNDVTVGDNDYTGDHPGDYTAASGYDMATGLGSPKAAAIAAGLCPEATDGSGTMTVDRTSVNPSSANTLTFTYSPDSGNTMTDGEVTVQVPANWTAPSTTPGTAGYTTSSTGTVSVSGTGPWTIDVQHASTSATGTLTIKYGNTVGGLAATAPAAVVQSSFTAAVRGVTGAGGLAALAVSPKVSVGIGPDGSGTMNVTPTTVNAGQATTLAFAYAPAANTGLLNGEVDLVVPADWTRPSAAPAAGYVTATGGSGANSVAVSGSGPWTVAVTSVSLGLGETLTITYGDSTGGGSAATAPANGEVDVFTAKQKATSGGTLKSLAASPSVQVNGPAADGSGTLTVSPTGVTTGSTDTLVFTYTPPAPTATVTSGEIDVAVPSGWTAPSQVPAAGYVTASGGSGSNAVAVSGSGPWTIAVSDVTLGAGEHLTITYGDTTGGGTKATAPSSAQTSQFTAKMGNTGSPAALSVSPSVSVTAPPPAGGGGGGGGIGGHPDLIRVSGADRVATSIAASNAAFPSANSARVVVLARSDSFADALAGTPLAASKGGPLLLTATAALSSATGAEISRVLPVGSTIYLLGGTSALSSTIETTLAGDGYSIARLAGADRYATSIAVANALGNPGTAFEADGTNFPDALSAGTAAAQQGAVVLLTAGPAMPAATAAYLTAHPSVRYAVGGPAAKADPGAVPLVGLDRYATSILVAQKFFTAPLSVGVASGVNFPDALSGGAVAGLNAGPMVLVPNVGTVSASTTNYLRTAGATASNAWLFGGTASVNDSVFAQVASALKAS